MSDETPNPTRGPNPYRALADELRRLPPARRVLVRNRAVATIFDESGKGKVRCGCAIGAVYPEVEALVRDTRVAGVDDAIVNFAIVYREESNDALDVVARFRAWADARGLTPAVLQDVMQFNDTFYGVFYEGAKERYHAVLHWLDGRARDWDSPAEPALGSGAEPDPEEAIGDA